MKRYAPPAPLFVVRVEVPATTANLGAGFDTLGLALDHHNEVELTGWDDPILPPAVVQVDGEGTAVLPLDKTNLVYRVARRAIDDLGGGSVTALRVKLVNRIPLARGLGSSSAAIVGGLVAANAAFGSPWNLDELVRRAVEEEGHPDNVVPALAGGLCAAAVADGRVHFVSWKDRALFRGLATVLAVPYFSLATEEARRVLPEQVPRADAVFNASRVALFLSALRYRRHELLGEAMRDRLHQPYRRALVPGLDEVLAAAREAGAWGAALSGAGPSALALAPVKAAARVGEAMTEAFRRKGVSSLALNLDVSLAGARVTHVSRQKRGAAR